MVSVPARLVTGDHMHEVRCEDGKYTCVVFVRDPEMDRELSKAEAMEFIDALRACQGVERSRAVRHDH